MATVETTSKSLAVCDESNIHGEEESTALSHTWSVYLANNAKSKAPKTLETMKHVGELKAIEVFATPKHNSFVSYKYLFPIYIFLITYFNEFYLNVVFIFLNFNFIVSFSFLVCINRIFGRSSVQWKLMPTAESAFSKKAYLQKLQAKKTKTVANMYLYSNIFSSYSK